MGQVLGQMRFEIGVDYSKMTSSLGKANQAVRYATAEMKANMAALGPAAKQVDLLSTKQAGLTKQMQAQATAASRLAKSYQGSLVNGEPGKQSARLATQLQNANTKLAQLNNEFINNARAVAKAKVETTGITGAMNRVGKTSISVGTKMSSMGSTMTSKVTTPIVAGLGLAVKSAIDFDSQISSMGPLLTNGGAVTAKYRKELEQLGNGSKTWAKQYGISTTVINDAMSELIKRGFTAQQTLGAMPSIMDASVASGEDLGTVMQATASIMEQFGLKGKTTAETLTNTQRVTDSLTYAANATAAGFGDMSEAMSYVGPVAKSVGMSVEDTAAAIGVLSNQGIEGQKAGTNLRGILTALVNPSKNAAGALKKMGISSKQAKEDASDLPKLIDDIKNGTKNWTAADKAQALAQVFGKQNQAAMNSLLAAGSGELRELTKNTESATGATKKIAEQMSATKANQIKRTVENIKQMGITIGQKLLPLLPPVLKNINGMVDAFGKLDSGTQQNIIKWVALAAAMGPVLSVGGKALTMFGSLNTGIVDVVSRVAQWRAGVTAAKEVNSIFAGSISATEKVVTTGATKTGIFSNVLTKLPGAFALSSTAAIAATGAIGAGILIWEGWGKKALQSAQETRRWGTDVGKANDQVLDKMSGLQGGTSLALEHFNSDVKGSSKTVADNFSKMSNAISKFAKKSNQDISNAYKGLDPYLQAAAKKSAETAIKNNNEIVKSAKDQATAVINVTKSAADKKRNLTSTEHQFIVQAQKDENAQLVKLMGLSAKDQKTVLTSLNGDIDNLTQAQANVMIKNVSESGEKIKKHYQEQYDYINQLEKKGAISSKEANAMRAKGQAQQSQAMENLASTAYELQARYGDLNKTNLESGRTGEQAALMFQKMGISLEDARKAYEKTGKSADNFKDSLVAVGNSKWDKNWNMNFLYDAQKGVIRTKDELVGFVKQATTSKDTWNNLKLIVQKAKVSPEGLEAVAQGITDAKAWNKVDLKTWTAMLEQKWGAGAKETWDWWINSGQVSKKDIELALAGDYTGVMKVINDTKQWNQMELGTKELFVKDKATIPLIDALQKTGDWQKLTPDEKKLIVNGDMASAAIGMLTIKYNAFDQLPDATKKALLNNDEFMNKLRETGSTLSGWASLPDAIKQILANDDQFMQKLADAKAAGTNFTADALIKKIKADTSDFNNKLNDVNTKINEDKQPKSKYYKADDTDFQNRNNVVNGLIRDGKNVQPATKVYSGNANGVVNASKTGKNSISDYNNKNPKTQNLNGNAKSIVNETGKGKQSITSFNSKKPDLKPLKGDSKSVVNETRKGKNGITEFNNKNPIDKYLKAHDKASGPAKDATREVAAFHRQGDHTVTLTTKKKTILQTIIEKITGKKKALGSQNFEGGLAVVNDQTGATFRERIDYPDGTSEIPTGRNVVRYIPKHSRIIPARMTARMHPGLPQFANGLNIPDNAEILTATEMASRSISQSNITVNTPTQDNSLIIDQLGKMISLLSSLVSKDSNVYLDQQKIAQLLDNQNGSNISLRERGVRI